MTIKNSLKSGLVLSSAISIFGANTAFSQDNGCVASNENKETVIYMSTGVGNTPAQTTIAAALLRRSYQADLESLRDDMTEFADEKYTFRSAPNPTQGTNTDVTQVMIQKAEELGFQDDGLIGAQIAGWIRDGLSFDEIRDRVAVGAALENADILLGVLNETIVTTFADTYADALVDALADRRTVDAQHLGFYQADIVAGKRVIIMAHSQGNLFTNKAVQELKNSLPNAEGSVGVIGVASAAAETVDGSFYVTANDDRVINGLRNRGQQSGAFVVLPANLDNDPGVFGDDRDISNHVFVESYFAPELASRPLINAEMTSLAQNLVYPTVLAGEGAIRATLTWDEQPDVDLHVFEPDGTQVYYRQPTGGNGMLDLDDVTSFGPENYFVPCDKISAGTFTIGANYFSGSAPTVARITLTLGDGQSVSPRTQTLSTARGSAGNSSPIEYFKVIVAQDTDGIYSYAIE